jgi:hypothetical protein
MFKSSARRRRPAARPAALFAPVSGTLFQFDASLMELMQYPHGSTGVDHGTFHSR